MTWILIAGILVVLTLPHVWRAAHNRFDPFEPIVLFSLAYGVMFVVRPVAMIVRDDTVFWGVDVRPKLTLALTLALVGAVGFVCAYEIGPGVSVAARLHQPGELDTRRAVALAVVTAVVGVVCLGLFVTSFDGTLRDALFGGRSDALIEQVTGSSTYLWYGSWLSAPAAYVLTVIAFRERSFRVALIAFPALVAAAIRVVPVGNRVILLPWIGGLFVLAYLAQNRRPGSRTIIVIAVVALLGSYVVLQQREPSSRASLVTHLFDRPQDIIRPIVRGPDNEMVEALSAGLTVVPARLSYRWGGATLGDLVVRPIPRQLWEGKPRPPGQEVVITLWPQYFPYLDPAFTPLLPLYWDFGVVGVLIGMAIFGVIARVLFAWFLKYRGVFGAQIVFSVAVWYVVLGVRNAPVDTIVFATFMLAPLVIIVSLARRPRTKSAAQRA